MVREKKYRNNGEPDISIPHSIVSIFCSSIFVLQHLVCRLCSPPTWTPKSSIYRLISESALENSISDAQTYSNSYMAHFWCAQSDKLFPCMKVSFEVWLESLRINLKASLLWMHDFNSTIWKNPSHCKRSQPP